MKNIMCGESKRREIVQRFVGLQHIAPGRRMMPDLVKAQGKKMRLQNKSRTRWSRVRKWDLSLKEGLTCSDLRFNSLSLEAA